MQELIKKLNDDQQMVFHLLDKLVLIIKLNIKKKCFFLNKSFLIKKNYIMLKEN